MNLSIRVICIMTVLLAVLFGGGCATQPPKPAAQAPSPSEQLQEMAMVDAVGDSGVCAAIVTQHTLFPYHFVAASFRLNDLGDDDLAVLVQHLRSLDGGDLNVRRGDASEALYAARVNYVKQQLQKAGIDVDQIRISDIAAAGEGMASSNVQRALDNEQKQGAYEPASSSKSGSNSNSSGSASTPASTGGQP